MAGITNAFYQEFKDFVKYNTETLEEIKAQVKKTNGRVNMHDTTLALSEERYQTCPARENSLLPNKASVRSNRIAISALLVVLVEVTLQFIFNIF